MPMGAFSRLGVLLAFAVLVACGDDEDEANSAVAKCEDLQDLWCNKALDCALAAGLVTAESRPLEMRECLTAARQAVPCGRAVSVAVSYDECVSDVAMMTCTPILRIIQGDPTAPNPVPANCLEVILIP